MNCIIIEDELPAQKVLQNYIAKIPELHLKSSFQSALEANSFLKNNTVDLVFLDINLPEISGLHYLRTLHKPPKVIITTAYPDYAVESFELETIYDYLVKPISLERFLKAVNKVRDIKLSNFQNKTLHPSEESIFINIDKTLHKIRFSDILYLVSDRNYLTIQTCDRSYVLLDALKNWLTKLPDKNFVQVHRAYIVNSDKINKINGNQVFIGQTKIPVGRTFRDTFREKFNL